MEVQAQRFGDKFVPGQLKVLWFISAIITELFYLFKPETGQSLLCRIWHNKYFFTELQLQQLQSPAFAEKKCIEMILLIRQEKDNVVTFH